MVVFQDRVPRYPGRVTMTPVSGQANTYDLARADDPAVVGTKINAALFESLTNELETLINERAKIGVTSYVGTGQNNDKYHFVDLGVTPKFVILKNSTWANVAATGSYFRSVALLTPISIDPGVNTNAEYPAAQIVDGGINVRFWYQSGNAMGWDLSGTQYLVIYFY